ncbi:hypothetical protein [Shimia sediminis]|uniref:hypothetical protein n=1 Tax=Shimia sediminis TaxID=2497945 RepID=UPI000F8C7E65|nr:hypothetical protein [Shimia sediminis]
MWVQLGLAASGALTLLATNVDNLAVLIALLLTTGRGAALGSFLTAQSLVLVAALVFAEGAEAAIAGWTGYLGIVPLGLGLWGIYAQWQSDQDGSPSRPVKGTFLGCLALFLGLSMDSFAAFAPLLADTVPLYRTSVVIGAGVALAGLGAAGVALSSGARRSGTWLPRLERLGPYAMIAVGLYVLSNTGTDAV